MIYKVHLMIPSTLQTINARVRYFEYLTPMITNCKNEKRKRKKCKTKRKIR